MPVLTRWQPLRISGRLIEHALASEACGRPHGARPARLVRPRAAERIPLAVSAPDSAPILAYTGLASSLPELIAR